MIRFQRHPRNPLIPRKPGGFFSRHTANPDLLVFKGRYYLYFRGQGEAGHDQIGVLQAAPEAFDGVHWEAGPQAPILAVGTGRDDFDSGHVLDPAALVWNDRVLLYYSAHHRDWKTRNRPSHIGLAGSGDGLHFTKSEHNPITPGTAPEVIVHQGKIHLFCQRLSEGGFFEIYCLTSEDGNHFPEAGVRKVFGPSRETGAFDCFSISTVRLWQEAEWFYMTYGGCDRFHDYPRAIGLARSQDLLHWERYPDNPILERGAPGAWDEGALWFATLFKKDGTYFLWYEGVGTSRPHSEASKQCREEDYGGYASTAFSQIGLATLSTETLGW